MNFSDFYWIGGSPCSGKSTVSEILATTYHLQLYRCDDHLQRFLNLGSEQNIPVMKKIKNMTEDQIWLRNVDEQVSDTIDFWKESLKYILDDLTKIEANSVVIEGAAILPDLVTKLNIRNDRYVCMIPTKEFQIENYRNRTWVTGRLSGCSNAALAFENWMERDVRFANIVKKESIRDQRNLMIVDGTFDINESFRKVKKYFKLDEK